MSTVKFFKALYNNEKHVKVHFEIFSTRNKPVSTKKVALKELDAFLKSLSHTHNYYFTPTHISGRRKKESAKVCYSLFFDFDGVKVPDKLKEYAHVISSRGDYHSHVYIFIKPFEIKNQKDIFLFEKAEKAVARYVQADISATDITRLLRVPLTYRNKNNEPPVKYNLAYEDYSKPRYHLQEIERHFASSTAYTKSEKQTRINTTLSKLLLHAPLVDGERTEFFYKAGCRCHDFGLTKEDAVKKLLNINSNPEKVSEPLDVAKIKTLVSDSYKYAQLNLGVENKKLQEKNEDIFNFLNGYSYVELEDSYINPDTQYIPKNALNNRLASYTGLQNNSLGYVHKYNLIHSYEKTVYAPYQTAVYEDMLNMWKDPKIKEEKGDVSLFLDFLRYLIPVKEERDHFLDYVAYSLQYPLIKINHAILLVGGRGVGKSTIGTLLEYIVGRDNIAKPSNDALREQFTGWLLNKKFCFVNEIKQVSGIARNELKARLDMILADNDLPIRKMRQEMVSVPNILSFIGCTNDDNAIYLTQDERRWCVLGCADKPHPDGEKFYDELYEALGEKKGVLLHFFKHRNVYTFNPKKPPKVQNAMFYTMLENSQSIVESWMIEAIQERHPVFFSELIESPDTIITTHKIEAILDHIDVPTQIRNLKQWNRKNVSVILKRLGAKRIRQRLENGSHFRFWDILPIYEKYKEAASLSKPAKVKKVRDNPRQKSKNKANSPDQSKNVL